MIPPGGKKSPVAKISSRRRARARPRDRGRTTSCNSSRSLPFHYPLTVTNAIHSESPRRILSARFHPVPSVIASDLGALLSQPDAAEKATTTFSTTGALGPKVHFPCRTQFKPFAGPWEQIVI